MHVPTPQKNSPTSIRNLLTKVVKKNKLSRNLKLLKHKILLLLEAVAQQNNCCDNIKSTH